MEFDFDQAKSVISDKANPHYQKYHNNDADVHGAVTRAFQRQYPGEIDISDTTPEALRDAPPPASSEPGDQAGADHLEVAGPEAAAKLAGFLGVAPGSPEFESFKQQANEYIAANFASYDDFHAAAAAVEAKIGPEAAIKMLRDAMRGRK